MIGRKLLPSILLSVALLETAVGGGAPAQLLESGLYSAPMIHFVDYP